MNFLYPQFLIGLLAISIPVVIHLFNLQKPKKLLFPNVKFLKQVQQSTSSKRTLKHLLILCARVLFISFLVLAFAQPFFGTNDTVSSQGKPFVSVYFDNSFSMQNELNEERAFDLGINSIRTLTNLFPSNSLYTITTNDFEGKDQFFRNKENLDERLLEIPYSTSYRSAQSVLNRQHQLMREQGAASKHIVWFTDFQRSTLGDLSKLTFDSSIHYHLVPIQNAKPSNIYIDSVWLENPLLKSGENNKLFARIVNSGTTAIDNFTVKLFIENSQVSSFNVSLEPNSFGQVEFIFNVEGEGQKKANIRIEDYPIVFDNDYFLTLSIAPKINILHLVDQQSNYIPKVYANESVFSVKSYQVKDFNYAEISNADLIIVEGISIIIPALHQSLHQFVSEGGSLMIFPSSQPDVSSYDKFISKFQSSTIRLLSQDTLQKLSYELLMPDYSNPFFSNVFEKKNKSFQMPFAIPSINWNNVGEKLLTYKNNDAYFSKQSYKKGNLYLASAPLTDKWSSVQRHSIFVPLMYKLALLSISQSERLSYTFQEKTIVISTNEFKATDVYSLKNGELSFIPAQWRAGDKLVLDVEDNNFSSGYYEVKKGDLLERTLAVNFGKEESIMEYYTNEEFAELEKNNPSVTVYPIDSSSEFLEVFQKETIGTPLWRYCLLLALAFLFIEVLLIRFYN